MIGQGKVAEADRQPEHGGGILALWPVPTLWHISTHLVNTVQTPQARWLAAVRAHGDISVDVLGASLPHHSVQLDGQHVVRVVGDEGSHHGGLSPHSQPKEGAGVLRHDNGSRIGNESVDGGLATCPATGAGEHNDELVGDGVLGWWEAFGLPVGHARQVEDIGNIEYQSLQGPNAAVSKSTASGITKVTWGVGGSLWAVH